MTEAQRTMEEEVTTREERLRSALTSWWSLSQDAPLEQFRQALREIRMAEKALSEGRAEEILALAFSTYRSGKEQAS